MLVFTGQEFCYGHWGAVLTLFWIQWQYRKKGWCFLALWFMYVHFDFEYFNNCLNGEMAWGSWYIFFLHEMPLILKVQCLTPAGGFSWLHLAFFHINSLFFCRFISSFACSEFSWASKTLFYSMKEEGQRTHHKFSWWNFQAFVGVEMGIWSL